MTYHTHIKEFFRKIYFKLAGNVVHLRSKRKIRGNVLLSYTTLPFISPRSIGGHSNRWECKKMVEIWNEAGYNVDIIDFDNEVFVPKNKYDYCIDIGHHLEKFSSHLGEECVKIFHITGAHWKFQNDAEMTRIADIEERRGAKISPRRTVVPSNNIETCDIATMLGNDFTASTYAFAGKKMIRIPISTTHTFPSPENKDFDRVRKNFIWLGGSGMAHKGLDLVLEAFADMPDFHLTIFGKRDNDFAEIYKKELSETANISYRGPINLESNEFRTTIRQTTAIVFPSCSEGGGGSVIECMHAGLIPIVSYESSVDIKDDLGIILKENTVEMIKKEVEKLSSLSDKEIKSMATKAWDFARQFHTKETFSKAYFAFVREVTKI